MEFLSILDKILKDNRQDPTESCKILQDRRQSYKIVQDPRENAVESS